MNHLVLARKWRPKRFADLVGQHNTVTILKNIIGSGRLHHAYLLTGTRGVGKTTIARIIAKALNCLNPSANEPCCECANCLHIDSGRFVDVIEIDAASNTGVDSIREVLENAQYAPTSGNYKIYIIDEVHMLSKSAFNAMLKTLEEPPAHVIFILATTDLQKVPITILSRCLQLKLRNLAITEIEQHLAYVLNQEKIAVEAKALTLLATAAHGSMRDALSLTDQAGAFANGLISQAIVEQMLGISDDGSILAILAAIQSLNSPELLKHCQRLNNTGSNLENILEQVSYALFQIGIAQLSPQPDISPAMAALAQNISLQDCQLYFEISNLGLEQIRKVNDKYPIFTMTLLRMIAFSIGSHQQKQIIVAENNCTTTLSEIPAEETPPLAGFDGNWVEFVKQADLSHLTPDIAMVLRNCSLNTPPKNDELNLNIHDKFRQAVTAECVDIIEQMLFKRFNCHYDLNFNFTQEENNQTLKSQENTQAKQRQALAEEAIRTDPIIQDLVTNFSAKILPNSIKPI